MSNKPQPLPAEERDVVLWFWNDRLQHDEITRQFEQLAAAGIGAVIPRTFNGLETEYLSEEFYQCIDLVLELAEAHHMQVWLQAGFMPGAVPELPDAHRLRVLQQDEQGQWAEGWKDGQLDLLSQEAVATYLGRAYDDAWYQRYQRYFGNVIRAMWVDEPHLKPPTMPWSESLLQVYQKRHQVDLRDHVAELMDDDSTHAQLRRNYWGLVQELIEINYAQPIQTWCENRQVAFSGHLMGEDHLQQQIGNAGGCQGLYRYFNIPGIDHLTAQVSGWPNPGLPFVLTPLQVSSVAARQGKRLVHSEVYGCAHSSIDFDDMCRIGDWLYSLGINLRVIHSVPYSLRGERKRFWPPPISPRQPWWPWMRRINDRYARLGSRLRQGQAAGDVLVLHPLPRARELFRPQDWQKGANKDSSLDIDQLQTRLVELIDNLAGMGRQVHLIEEDELTEAQATASGLQVGCCHYRCLVIPSAQQLTAAQLSSIQQWQQQGVAVYALAEATDEFPDLPTLSLPRLQRQIAEQHDAPLPLQQLTGGRTAFRTWSRLVDGQRVALVHNADEAQSLHLRWQSGCWQCWNPDTDRTTASQQELILEPLASRIVIEDPTGAHLTPTPVQPTRQALPLAGPWTLQTKAPNVLLLDRCHLQRGDDDSSCRLPVTAIGQYLEEDEPWRGATGIDLPFILAENLTDVHFVMEQIDGARISVNGQALDARAALPGPGVGEWRYTIGRYLTVGENHISIDLDFVPRHKAAGLFSQIKTSHGSDVELFRLEGDFRVCGQAGVRPVQAPCRRLEPQLALYRAKKTGSGDLMRDGYPFYAGMATYSRSLDDLPSPAEDERVFVEFPGARSHGMEILVDGKLIAPRIRQPWRVEITDALRAGGKQLAVRIATSLRNIYGPVHRPQGEPRHHWGAMTMNGRWSHISGRGYERWYEATAGDTDAWSDDYILVTYGLGEDPQVVYQYEQLTPETTLP
jgi:hypothetical protein